MWRVLIDQVFEITEQFLNCVMVYLVYQQDCSWLLRDKKKFVQLVFRSRYVRGRVDDLSFLDYLSPFFFC